MKLGWVGLFLFILLIHGWAFIYTPGPARSWHRNRGGAATLRAHGLGVGRPGGVKLLGVTQGNKERSIGASCQGDASAEPTFSELYRDELPPWLFNRVEDLGFVHPTTVQTKALKAVIAGEDVVLQAQTGSGKTLAFMLPLLAGIDSKKKAVQALVVVPSRELGLQVASVAKRLAAGRVLCRDEEDDDAEGATMGDGGAADTQQQQEQQGSEKILIMSLLEGSKNRRQRAWARAEPPHVVIGNPLALSNLVAHNGIKYNQVKLVVVDEVDACLLQQETRAQLHALLAKYLSPSYLTAELEEEAENGPKEGFTESFFKPWKLARRQTVFCSATIPQHNHFIKQCMQQQWTLREPVHIQVTPGELIPSCLKHKYLTCPSKDHKVMALRSLLKREGPRLRAAIVFTASEEDADDIAAAIEGIDDAHGVAEGGAAAELTGSSKESRQVRALLRSDHIKRRAGIMDDFRAGVTRILVATDYAARGLDVPEVSHVIMYDIPTDADTYLHRGGRAGRMGREGFVISIVSESEGFALLRLANSLSIDVKRMGAVRAASSARRSR